MSGDINIVIIIELSNSLAFFITLFEYLRNLNIILKPFGFQLLYHFRFRPVHRNTEKLRHVLLCESVHAQHQKHQERKTPHFHDFHILTFRPTPLPESIKSLIVYIYEKSAGVCTCCSFRYSRLSHCPSLSERATQKPTPICLYIRPLYPCKTHMDTIGAYIKHTHRASTVALSSTVIRTCEILSSQRIKASSKRLLYICHPMPSHLRRGFRMGTYGKYTENNPTIRNFLLQKFSLTYKALYYNYLQIIKEHKIILRKTENQSQENDFSFS